MDRPTHVTYYYENGAVQICNLNNYILYNIKGRMRSKAELFNIFADTAHDLGAVRFEMF